MRGKMIPVVLMALTLAASSVVAVQAGGGGAGVGDSFMLNCYQIHGSNPPHVLAVNDQFIPDDSPREGVRVGNARLLCTPADGVVTSGHDLRTGLTDADHLKCYEALPHNDAPRVPVQVVDAFGQETVKVGNPRFICVGAFKCPVGEPCP